MKHILLVAALVLPITACSKTETVKIEPNKVSATAVTASKPAATSSVSSVSTTASTKPAPSKEPYKFCFCSYK